MLFFGVDQIVHVAVGVNTFIPSVLGDTSCGRCVTMFVLQDHWLDPNHAWTTGKFFSHWIN